MAGERPPDGNRRQHYDRDRRFALAEAERRPDEHRDAHERDRGVCDRRVRAAEHEVSGSSEREERQDRFERLRAIPADQRGTAPDEQQRSDEQRAGHVTEPPREPDGSVRRPRHEAAGRERGDAQRRAHHGRGHSGERDEPEDVGRAIERAAAPREPRDEIGAEHRFERVADGDPD